VVAVDVERAPAAAAGTVVGVSSLPDEFYAGLPAVHVAAGCVMRDGEGRVLLLHTTYKQDWEIPGGSVEAHESPREAARREVREELGLDVAVGGLLCVDYVPARPPRPDALRFLFAVDGPPVALAGLRLQEEEIKGARYCTPGEVVELASAQLARRLGACLTASRLPVYLEDGVPAG
jgi:8-oxo-dGTP pyrophosphatase MutT (NUDIX family)